MSKVLVTGGAGFIGSHVVRLLAQEGRQVTVLDDLSSGYRANLTPSAQVTFLEGDVRNPEVVGRAVASVETVFHLAASVGNARSIEHPVQNAEINILGTLRVMEAARRAKVRKVVFSSSAAIFGEPKTLPIADDHPTEPNAPYGASKLGAEKLCLAYSRLYEVQVVSLRYFNVYGVNQRYDVYGNVIPIFAHRMLRGLPLVIYGDGEQTRDFVNVRDVAEANLRAALAQDTGVFNIGSGKSTTIKRLAELMQQAAGTQATIERRSPRKGDTYHSLSDVSEARAAFGYEPTVELEDGLAEYMDWIRKERV